MIDCQKSILNSRPIIYKGLGHSFANNESPYEDRLSLMMIIKSFGSVLHIQFNLQNRHFLLCFSLLSFSQLLLVSVEINTTRISTLLCLLIELQSHPV
jgi:hypothetical protein